jgi:bacillithiol system protein YtxJ
MNWTKISTPAEIDAILAESHQHPVLLFKHSTRCVISATALARVERKWKEADNVTVKPYFLDLIAHRPTSQYIAEATGVEHQSPQAIVVQNGKVVYQATHMSISYSDIMAAPVAA